jgi:hypothetical protein
MLKSIMVLTRQPRSEGNAFARAALLAERHAARLRVIQLQALAGALQWARVQEE